MLCSAIKRPSCYYPPSRYGELNSIFRSRPPIQAFPHHWSLRLSCDLHYTLQYRYYLSTLPTTTYTSLSYSLCRNCRLTSFQSNRILIAAHPGPLALPLLPPTLHCYAHQTPDNRQKTDIRNRPETRYQIPDTRYQIRNVCRPPAHTIAPSNEYAPPEKKKRLYACGNIVIRPPPPLPAASRVGRRETAEREDMALLSLGNEQAR